MLTPGSFLTFSHHYLRARRQVFATRKALEIWQEKRARRHLRQIAANSPYYGQLAREIPVQRWREWPTVDKARMLAGFNEMVTVPVTFAQAMAAAQRSWERRDFSQHLPGDLTVGLSSGTSGSAGIFIANARERAAWAGAVLGRALPRGLFSRGGPQRIAFFLRANSSLYEATRSRRVRFEFFDLIGPWERHFARLQTLRPTVLVAPPSALRIIGEGLMAGTLSFPIPERIISVAEVLESPERMLIEKAFRQTIHQVYQATEGFIAATCPFGVLHLNEDLMIVEKRWLDERTERFVPVLTDLYRATQPTIRYELNDVLIARKTPCPCRSVFQAIDAIEGRTDDFCQLYRSDGSVGEIFPDYLRLAVTTTDHNIKDYFIRNPRPGELEISLFGDAATLANALTQDRVTARVRSICAEGGFAAPSIRFVPAPPLTVGAKLRRITRGNQSPAHAQTLSELAFPSNDRSAFA